jgi:ParB family chromosome partitioning protein
VPVLVVADERTDDAGTVERIVRQYAENEHRTGLTASDRLGVVEQLALSNVSAGQIAERTRMKRPQVDQALAVARSDLAKAASVQYELTIDQAAAVAEFDDDPETVKALVAAAKTGVRARAGAGAVGPRRPEPLRDTLTGRPTQCLTLAAIGRSA